MRVTVSEQGGKWHVFVARPPATPLRFAYASRTQARYFAAIFRLGPRAFPAAHRVPRRSRRRSAMQSPQP